MYSEATLQLFNNPRNAGDLPNATSRAVVENPVCGDVLELSVLIEDARIQAARFRAQGCVPLIACSEALTELIDSLTVSEAAIIGKDQLSARVGPIPQASSHALEICMEAMRKVLLMGSTAATKDQYHNNSIP